MPADHQPAREKVPAVPRDLDLKSRETSADTVGVAFGVAAGSAAAGMAGLAMGGPPGMVVGAITGALAGAYAAKSVSDGIDPVFDPAYWQTRYPSSNYYDENTPFTMFEPAYRMGWVAYSSADEERPWVEREAELQREWEQRDVQDSGERLDWSRARAAVHDAYHRAAELFHGSQILADDSSPDDSGATSRPR